MFPVDQFPKAICRRVDPDVMFPTDKDTDGIEAAKATCEFCPHSAQCLETALALTPARDKGVRAGTTQDERKRIRRKRAAAARRKQQTPVAA
ncbi:WhiB family transcriptional regulator [Kitasatospora sp. NPDC090091]|uniref:WhiB family transcriptional regulator n=1 Tax=Kitasatospora sp. NPDC090091 TaxID=3364081 RepID=UPI003811AB63